MRLFMDLFKIYAQELTDTEESRTLIDSSVWIAFWLTTDSQHAKGLELVKNFSAQSKIYTHSIIATEVLTVLRNRKARNIDIIYREILDEIYGTFDNTPLDLASIQPFFVKFPKLSIVDAFLLYLSWDKNYTLVTLDKNLYKIAQKLGLKAYGVK